MVDAQPTTQAGANQNRPRTRQLGVRHPHSTLGLRRMNSTRNRAIPLNTRYSPTIAPVPCCLPPRHHSYQPISKPMPKLIQRSGMHPDTRRSRFDSVWESSCPTAASSRPHSSRRRKESTRSAQCHSQLPPPERPDPAFATRRSSPTIPETPAPKSQIPARQTTQIQRYPTAPASPSREIRSAYQSHARAWRPQSPPATAIATIPTASASCRPA